MTRLLGLPQEALERVSDLIMDLSLIQAHSGAAKELGDGLSEFQTYIGNNQEYIPNYGDAQISPAPRRSILGTPGAKSFYLRGRFDRQDRF